MVDTRHFAGNSMAAFTPSTSTPVESTSAGTFNSSFVANSIQMPGDSAYIETTAFSESTLLWMRWSEWKASNGASNNDGPEVWASGNGIFRIATLSGYTQQCQYWNGSAWTNTGSTFALLASALNVFAVKIDLVAGSFELYRNNVLVASGSGWTGYSTTATKGRFYSKATGSSSYSTYYSEIMIANYDIRNSHFLVPAINGDSSTNTGQASGVYTDVNEVPYSDATLISIQTSGNKAGQTKASITLDAGYTISAMVLSMRALVNGTITDGKLGIRSGTTNYSSGALGVASSFGANQYIADNDPDTAAAWSESGFNSAEIYEEAV